MNTYADEKSDEGILPMKRSNKGVCTPVEVVEGSASPKGNVSQPTAVRTQRRGAASSGLDSVREVAQVRKDERFTALLHHITVELLEQSYNALQRRAAPGIDGVTWRAYGENLEEKLTALHSQIHRGSYRASAARRITIPKADGTERALSVLCVEDKIVQQAVVSVVEAIYETDFVGFSYGFRPERGQHDALDALSAGIYRKRVNWVLDLDVRGFFDAMSHDWTVQFLQHRIADKRLLRLIMKWLKVGVMEDRGVVRSERGTPQGAVISPLLANVYLHYVFDLWANAWRQKQASGDMVIIRYADDAVLGFEHENEARAFLQQLQERLATFDLALHPDKTRIIEFGRHAIAKRKNRGEGKPETFAFLGFTHFCTYSRKNGSLTRYESTLAVQRKRECVSLLVSFRPHFGWSSLTSSCFLPAMQRAV